MSHEQPNDPVMPIGPHAGKLMRDLDLDYLERCLSFESHWKDYRPLFLTEIKRRQEQEVRKHRELAEAEVPIEPGEDKLELKVRLPAWLVKRIKIQSVMSGERMQAIVTRALQRELEQ